MKTQTEIQVEHAAWSNRNFKGKEGEVCAREILRVLDELQNADPTAMQFDDPTADSLIPAIQRVLMKHYGLLVPLAGMMEELGELAHATLKSFQGIRTNEDHEAAKVDAHADLQLYGMDYATRAGFCAEVALNETWSKVSQRDWIEHPETGT